jgi:division protein CdvB (Snf7/Vps24/ESCRT-III family)
VSENNLLERLAAEIRRLEEQRDAAAARIEQATQNIEESRPQGEAFAPVAYAAEETAVAEHMREVSNQEGAAVELPQYAASTPSWLSEETGAHRNEEERCAVHRKRYEELAEERYEAELEIEEALSKLVESLKRLKAINADQHREAEAAGIPMEYDHLSRLIEGRLSGRLKRWIAARTVGSSEAYNKPLHEIDERAQQPNKS